MTPADEFRRAEALFRDAVALPPSQRDAYLAERCSDHALLAKVRSLLAADAREDGVFDRPALLSAGDLLAASLSEDTDLPKEIGRYRIIRKIGEGGMGTVYEAEQENPRRRVALKVLRAGAGSHRLGQRFAQEAQILGRLRHPCIAQILEAGVTDDGRTPFLVMELVHGRTLLEHVHEAGLDRRQRLELFELVCDAVDHAHRAGVVHRDLKPANILVVDADEAPDERTSPPTPPTPPTRRTPGRPKILDFGVARLTDSDAPPISLQTAPGELIGTLPYMSPEQAAGDPAQLDLRSDVFALGVILYELLTGRLPHDVRRLMVIEAMRVIREDDPTPAGSLDRSLRGDLETILAKALEKDKTRRYQSAAELASDIRRYLSEQPIAARPASAVYRLRKLARRNKAIFTGIGVAFLALAIGTAVATRQAFIAERARAAEARLRTTAERQSYHTSMMAASAALKRHEVAEARRYLEAAPAALRAWEWAHFASRLDDTLVQRSTAGFRPWCSAISPDGATVAACSSGGRIVVWNLADWSERARYSISGGVTARRINQLVFSPDGATLRADTAIASTTLAADSLAFIDQTARPMMLRGPDGATSARLDRNASPPTIRVERFESGDELFCVAGEASPDTKLAFSKDGRLLAAARPNNQGVVVHRSPDGTLVWQRPDLKAVADLEFTSDATRLGVTLEAGDGLVLDAASGTTVTVLRRQERPLGRIAFSPDARRVATASNDGTMRIWDAATGEPISTMHASQADLYGMEFMPDGATVVTSGVAGMHWWDASAAADPFVLPAPGYVYGLAFSPDGATLAAASLSGERPLRIWDTATGAERFAGLDGNLSAVAYSPDSKRLVVCQRGDTRLVSADDGRTLLTLNAASYRTDWAAFDPKGDRLFTMGFDGRLRAYDTEGKRTYQHIFRAPAEGHGCRAALNPDGSVLAVAAGRDIHVLDTNTWKELATLSGHTGNIYAITFSPDGSRLVSGGIDRDLRVWDAANATPVATLKGHTEAVFAVTFSPDGKRLFSGGRDNAIRVWDGATFDEITQLHGHTSYVYCLAFSPDGQTLASGSGDGTVRLWGTRPYRERAGH